MAPSGGDDFLPVVCECVFGHSGKPVLWADFAVEVLEWTKARWVSGFLDHADEHCLGGKLWYCLQINNVLLSSKI